MKVPEFEFLKFVTVAIGENVIEIIDFFGVLAAVVLVAVFFTLDRIHDAFDILVDDDLCKPQMERRPFRISNYLVQVVFLRLFLDLPG